MWPWTAVLLTVAGILVGIGSLLLSREKHEFDKKRDEERRALEKERRDREEQEVEQRARFDCELRIILMPTIRGGESPYLQIVNRCQYRVWCESVTVWVRFEDEREPFRSQPWSLGFFVDSMTKHEERDLFHQIATAGNTQKRRMLISANVEMRVGIAHHTVGTGRYWTRTNEGGGAFYDLQQTSDL